MTDSFERFWAAYPKGARQAKPKCREKWNKLNLDAKAEEIIAHVEIRAKRDKKWLQGYVPITSTFINQGRWEDDYETVEPKREAPERPNPVLEPPPQDCVWTGAVNTFLLKCLISIGGRMRPQDFTRVVLTERDRFVADMRAAYGERIPQQDSAEWLEIKDAWKAKMRKAFRDYDSSNPESAWKSLEAAP